MGTCWVPLLSGRWRPWTSMPVFGSTLGFFFPFFTTSPVSVTSDWPTALLSLGVVALL